MNLARLKLAASPCLLLHNVRKWTTMEEHWKLIVEKMAERMAQLEARITMDYSGGLHGFNEAWREVKYWKEAIERGEFNR